MITLNAVLVATDFSAPSEKALDYGRALARTFGASLHVLNVVENVMAYSVTEMGAAVTFANIQQEFEAAAQSRLEATVREDDRRELKARPVVRTSSSPATAIVSYAKEAGIDVIVIGTHGRTGLSHLVMGSVAERVVRLAHCPVLTVRDPEHDFLMPDALQVAARVSSSS